MRVNFSGNGLGCTAALAWCEVLLVNRTLTWINLVDNQLGAKGAAALAGALQVGVMGGWGRRGGAGSCR